MYKRGDACIVGIAETPHKREWPGRSERGLCAEAAAMAIKDAGLTKEDIDGLITYGGAFAPAMIADYIGIRPIHYAAGMTMFGASSAAALITAAAVVNEGIANYVMWVGGGARDTKHPFGGIFMGGTPGPRPHSSGNEFEAPFGPAVAANNAYGYMYARHMYRYGSKPEQFAQMAVNKRFNAQANPNSAFQGQPITVEDVLSSRYINWPLHILECVMPCAGATSFIVTTAERAKALPNPPAFIMGMGLCQYPSPLWRNQYVTETGVKFSAPSAYKMAGYNANDMQFAEFYDWYTILEACCLEDAQLCGMRKGDIGPFFESTDTTYKGTFPINTDGGQMSTGQLNAAGVSGSQQIVEGTRQIMGRAGERQVPKHDLCLVNCWGGPPSQMGSIVLGTENTL